MLDRDEYQPQEATKKIRPNPLNAREDPGHVFDKGCLVQGEKLGRRDSQPYLVKGLVRTINRLKRTGARVVVIRDQARSPFLPHECVADNLDNLDKCAFEPRRRSEWAFDRDAARRTGVKLIDPMPILCRNGGCPAVIGEALVYRDTYHLSATFARTLAPWLSRQLPNLD